MARALRKPQDASNQALSIDYSPYTKEGIREYEHLKSAALEVAKEFPGLCPAAFWEEVRHRFYPHPDTGDMKDVVLRMVCDGDLVYGVDWKVRLP